MSERRRPDPGLLSINTATLRGQWDLGQIFDGCARHGVRGVSPWRDQVQAIGLKEAAAKVREHGFAVTGYCRGGMFPGATPAERLAARDDNRKAVDEALELGAQCLVLVVGGLPKGSKDVAGARAQVRDGIGELLDYARPRGMPLAIEPLHPMYAADRACVNTTAHANDLCDELGDDGLGIALDVYHVEPLPPDHPLWGIPNAILTPHTAGYSPAIARRHLETLAENAGRFARGEALINAVDKKLWF